MAVNIKTQKRIYSNEITKVTDTTFESFNPPQSTDNTPEVSIPTVDEFFEYYDVLFYEIPKEGDNSHESLISRSSEYVGLNLEALYTQLKDLQNQNKLLQQQIDTFNGSTN
jgi:hypothetical protein